MTARSCGVDLGSRIDQPLRTRIDVMAGLSCLRRLSSPLDPRDGSSRCGGFGQTQHDLTFSAPSANCNFARNTCGRSVLISRVWTSRLELQHGLHPTASLVLQWLHAISPLRKGAAHLRTLHTLGLQNRGCEACSTQRVIRVFYEMNKATNRCDEAEKQSRLHLHNGRLDSPCESHDLAP